MTTVKGGLRLAAAGAVAQVFQARRNADRHEQADQQKWPPCEPISAVVPLLARVERVAADDLTVDLAADRDALVLSERALVRYAPLAGHDDIFRLVLEEVEYGVVPAALCIQWVVQAQFVVTDCRLTGLVGLHGGQMTTEVHGVTMLGLAVVAQVLPFLHLLTVFTDARCELAARQRVRLAFPGTDRGLGGYCTHNHQDVRVRDRSGPAIHTRYVWRRVHTVYPPLPLPSPSSAPQPTPTP
jgi:hypothetical protein